MPNIRPTLQQICEQIENDIYTRFNGLLRAARFSFNKILARSVGGAIHLVYGYIDWISLQLIIDTATGIYLERWAGVWKIKRKPATRSIGKIVFKGNEGSKITSFTLMQTSDGFKFQTMEDSIITGGKAVVNIEALESGIIGNIAGETILNLVSPISGVLPQCTIEKSGTYSGSDIEDDSSLRARLLDRISNAPCAGNKKDYEQWALEISGITRAWCYKQFPADGSVGLSFVRDNDSNIIPNTEQIDAVYKTISERMTTTASLLVFAPKPNIVDFVLKSTDVSQEAEKQIRDQLKFLFFNAASPNSKIYTSDILESLSAVKSIKKISLISPLNDIEIGNTSVGIVGDIKLKEF